MRHHRANRKFGRERGQRVALLRTLTSSLILHGKIQTNAIKAKELRPFVEKLVTRAKTPTVANRRLLHVRIGNTSIVSRLIKEVAPKYQKRQGGYTRISKLGVSRKDGTAQSIIEFV